MDKRPISNSRLSLSRARMIRKYRKEKGETTPISIFSYETPKDMKETTEHTLQSEQKQPTSPKVKKKSVFDVPSTFFPAKVLQRLAYEAKRRKEEEKRLGCKSNDKLNKRGSYRPNNERYYMAPTIIGKPVAVTPSPTRRQRKKRIRWCVPH